MSLCQVGFFVLPGKCFLKSYQEHTLEITDEHYFDDARYWKAEQVPCDFFAEIGSILPINASWNEMITLYGEQDSNRFEVFSDGKNVESVSFRIDFTSNYEDILRDLIEFFIMNDLVILDNNLEKIPLNFDSVRSVIESAPQVEKYRMLSKNK
jgi:hypothetical protein